MAGVPTGSGVERSTEGVLSNQRYQCDEALAEWRSCEQVENETPSTSLPYWDCDDSDYYLSGPKPSELYGSHTWNIDNFSQINTRELKSDTFEIGGRKWYILIYPQGCDVCNHLSLFLCVANHDNLLPGWGHFAQFTIGLVNKDPKKSKYSDTLHRFSKREHDWGWKKFMELSKVLDGFIDADTLIIQAKVQVIRERPDRPFRCLDRLYRRELVRVYLANLEQIFWCFAEERHGKHGKLIADKTRWASLRAFWLGKDQKSRCDMSREKTGSILKVLVKHFFIEKEVTSTLVMDSLYSGLKAIEGQRRDLKSKGKYLETEELPNVIIRMDKDTFVLVDDVLTLLERAAIEPLPPKDEKVPQNRTKDGSLGEELNKDLTERDDRLLTELGRRTIEMFTFAHIFSKIEVAYQEDLSLKRQDELIREEELACLAQTEQKARRGAADKEKKSKKKQGKQKRNNRKGKDKGKDDKQNNIAQIRMDQDIHTVENKDFVDADLETALEKFDVIEDIVSDASDSVEFVPETLPLGSEDRDMGPTETGTNGISGLSNLQNGIEVRTSSEVDDSSSACSSDSAPFVVVNGHLKNNSLHQKNRRSPGREANHQNKVTSDPADWVNAEPSQPSKPVLDVGCTFDASGSSKAVHSVSQVAYRVVNGSEKRVAKEEEFGSLHKTCVAEDVDLEVSRDRTFCSLSLPISPTKNIPPNIHSAKNETKGNAVNVLPTFKKSSPERYINKQTDQSSTSKSPSQKNFPTLKPTEKPKPQQATNTAEKIPKPPTPFIMSRPSAVNLAPTVQTAPFLPRSQSYRNAIVDPGANTSFPCSNAPSQSFSFGMVNPTQPSLWMESPHRDSLINDMQSSDMYSSMRPILQDDFPHLDIINELLDDEHGIGNPSVSIADFQGFGDGPRFFNRHVSFPGDLRSCRFDRPWSYEEDGFQHGYGLSRTPYDARLDVGPQAGFGVYANGQVEDLVPHNQWQVGVSDHPFVGFGSDSYRVGEYQNPSGGVNGYSVFRQSSDL